MGTLASGCDPGLAPSSRGREERITEDLRHTHATKLAPSSEASATWSLNATDDTVVVGFNDYSGFGLGGWAWTEDAGAADPTMRDWHYCNMDLGGCGPGGGPVPRGTSGLSTWLGDPHLAAANDGSGLVVYTSLAGRDIADRPANLVAMAISTDGGRTFRNTVAVNELNCHGGSQDQQAVTFDTTTVPPTVWVAWRHRNVFVGGTYGACVRRGVVDVATATVNWLGQPEDVENLAVDTAFDSIGGIYIEAHQGIATLAYLQQRHCGNSADLGSPARFWSVSTATGGVTWGPSAAISLGEVAPCLTFSNRLTAGQRVFGFTHNANFSSELFGEQWAVVPVQYDSLRVFRRATVNHPWTEAVTLPPPSAAPGVTASVLYPTIAVDAAGAVAVGRIVSDPTGVLAGYHVTVSLTGRTVWSAPVLVSDEFVPFTTGGNQRWLGDYNGLVGSPFPFATLQPRFFAAWADEFEIPGRPTTAGAFVEVPRP